MIHAFPSIIHGRRTTQHPTDTTQTGDDFIAIPGTKRIKYLEENLQSVNVNITEEEDKQIREIIKSIEIKGNRYPDMSGIGL